MSGLGVDTLSPANDSTEVRWRNYSSNETKKRAHKAHSRKRQHCRRGYGWRAMQSLPAVCWIGARHRRLACAGLLNYQFLSKTNIPTKPVSWLADWRKRSWKPCQEGKQRRYKKQISISRRADTPTPPHQPAVITAALDLVWKLPGWKWA